MQSGKVKSGVSEPHLLRSRWIPTARGQQMKNRNVNMIDIKPLFRRRTERQRTLQTPQRDFRIEAERVNTRTCANLTLVLDNWKYAIVTQVKDLLLHGHSTVLPDYGRIQPLSDALGHLYKEFNALKEHLAELTAKFDGVEAFVEEVRSGRNPAPHRGEPRPGGSLPPASAAGAGGRPLGRRSRVVVRRIKTPAHSQD
ncbi:hypothetical protein Q8A73_020897 [Channa argus]|nr:hypothetical protein Q8A73_020897 [Channa argus]